MTLEYVKLGRSGLEVSRICLGCMSFGVPDGGHWAWVLNEEQSRPIIKRALELGDLTRPREPATRCRWRAHPTRHRSR